MRRMKGLLRSAGLARRLREVAERREQLHRAGVHRFCDRRTCEWWRWLTWVEAGGQS